MYRTFETKIGGLELEYKVYVEGRAAGYEGPTSATLEDVVLINGRLRVTLDWENINQAWKEQLEAKAIEELDDPLSGEE